MKNPTEALRSRRERQRHPSKLLAEFYSVYAAHPDSCDEGKEYGLALLKENPRMRTYTMISRLKLEGRKSWLAFLFQEFSEEFSDAELVSAAAIYHDRPVAAAVVLRRLRAKLPERARARLLSAFHRKHRGDGLVKYRALEQLEDEVDG